MEEPEVSRRANWGRIRLKSKTTDFRKGHPLHDDDRYRLIASYGRDQRTMSSTSSPGTAEGEISHRATNQLQRRAADVPRQTTLCAKAAEALAAGIKRRNLPTGLHQDAKISTPPTLPSRWPTSYDEVATRFRGLKISGRFDPSVSIDVL